MYYFLLGRLIAHHTLTGSTTRNSYIWRYCLGRRIEKSFYLEVIVNSVNVESVMSLIIFCSTQSQLGLEGIRSYRKAYIVI